eukprot:CAMPEP_0182417796 /NCGR_PEP_ID=MMETSP1167-20130531/2231_1 /TAXON_ID=2988 /ORGANISM="Mallomonas Sp, Strain CCMP3275" /LENGTH=107 /DNA_ID=CAMNT_0024591567 /DNA_START=593 /DNA_END=916 /DNA_ORIENTATION=-
MSVIVLRRSVYQNSVYVIKNDPSQIFDPLRISNISRSSSNIEDQEEKENYENKDNNRNCSKSGRPSKIVEDMLVDNDADIEKGEMEDFLAPNEEDKDDHIVTSLCQL